MLELSSRRGRRLPAHTGKVSLALGLCLCAGQLMAPAASAAPASAPAAVTTGASAAAVKVKPKIGVTPTRRTIARGAKAVFTVTVTENGRAVKGGTVRLQVLRSGRWSAGIAVRVPASGKVRFGPQPGATTSYRFAYSGTARYYATNTGNAKVTVAAPANRGARALAVARSLVGSPYRFGATGPRAFDCSGFTKYVYKKALGRSLPHKARSQAAYGRAVSKANARPGDLIYVSGGAYAQHVGVYAGNGYMYDSPRPGKRVGKHKIYNRNYVVRRLA